MAIEFTTDKQRIDTLAVIAYLHKHSYWARERPREVILRSIENSLCVSVHLEGRQIGFARIVSDFSTVFYLCDVFIIPEYQNRGYGGLLMDYIHGLPDLRGLRGILTTQTAHAFYSRFGYSRDNDIVNKRIMIRTEGNTCDFPL